MTDNAVPEPFRLDVRFEGSGSEYFRIWIVNLLFIVLTLGIYYPWAKVRRLRYFHGNTLVGGEPLDFHGDPGRMFKGYAVSGLLFGLYSWAGTVSPLFAFVVLLGLVAVSPLLLRSAMRFRLGNTSWRALRFGFTGSLADAYRAMLPLQLPFVAFLAIVAWTETTPGGDTQPTLVQGLGVIAVLLLGLVAMPWLLWLLVRYQRNHLAFAGQLSRFDLKPRALYGLGFKALGGMVVAFGLMGLLVFLSARAQVKPSSAVMALLPLLVMVLIFWSLLPYVKARLQNLLWNHTRTQDLRIASDLRARSLVGLTIRNWLLILLTLGFYWPFAAAATARLRLQAVTVYSQIDPDDLVQRAQAEQASAVGDAAADWFDFDIGF